MNPYTGHLTEGFAPGYESVPEGLRKDAEDQLRLAVGECFVNLEDDKPLSRWAADRRREIERKRAKKASRS